ncbi:mannitol-1-phosphate 5-dehydrogenase [Microbacteriaceae bacterium SG_E_30_P1]|uniref:Mannitol-1-phosphate 5-dehydrogenase n=1 Tax=Antiquaquibacter oligotrophicus TaxID=2880260 RepID=A0ABT6KP48_9MICO|nr:mannitol-1-phosphate 5-dehydrogenase [Antiquaquibacter oligotrophicus]MDH6181768.1 mannitol-1-phosphate 5-dehydrogenase [Antiquaquibacter oligotrophicus]UDF12551.1 mannitol-1-phosphate 5-dehydrogenase [Antiquaquibacter oligotrophicus]
MKAVHFGAGNIGRGFVGLILHRAGYEVVFADVAAPLIDALDAAESYVVHEVGEGARDHVVTGFRAINSATNESALIAEIASADIVTTAVGPGILKFVAPVIARALEQRETDAPLAVMACENAINATDILRGHVAEAVSDRAVLERAVFANTAVDRIVPAQPEGAGLDVTVETYFEWAIESPPFAGAAPVIPDAHWVEDLAPYIERKLFTVNTGHATIAYAGHLAGVELVYDALALPEVDSAVRAVLAETKALLVAKHGLDADEQQAYIERILTRFANTALPDRVDRVGRQPLRKLSRDERFISPAAELAESGTEPSALLSAVGTALRFVSPDDEQSLELQVWLGSMEAEQLVTRVTGIEPSHPLFGGLVREVKLAQSRTA